jgi:hypothetical protein
MNVSCNVQLKGTTKQNKGQKEGRIHTSAARSCLCHSGSIDTFELAEGFDFTANSICALYGNRIGHRFYLLEGNMYHLDISWPLMEALGHGILGIDFF